MRARDDFLGVMRLVDAIKRDVRLQKRILRLMQP
jgi:hypothetical protein